MPLVIAATRGVDRLERPSRLRIRQRARDRLRRQRQFLNRLELNIQLETVEELPLTAKAVAGTLTDTQTGRALQTIDATRRGDDQWHAAVAMPSAGRWMLALAIAISDNDK